MTHHRPPLRFTLNGRPVAFETAPTRRLSDLIREEAGLTGTKVGCDAGDCGACTVLLDGEPVCACLTPAARAAGAAVTTVEGLAGPRVAALQAAFLAPRRRPVRRLHPRHAGRRRRAPRPRPAPDRGRGRRRPRRRALPLHRLPPDHRRRPRRHRRAAARASPPAGAAIGARLPRLDGRPKVDGTERFGADASPAGRPHAPRHPLAASARRLRLRRPRRLGRRPSRRRRGAHRRRHPRPQPLRRHPALRRPARPRRDRDPLPRRAGRPRRARGPGRATSPASPSRWTPRPR